jgi:hypothetical protein
VPGSDKRPPSTPISLKALGVLRFDHNAIWAP